MQEQASGPPLRTGLWSQQQAGAVWTTWGLIQGGDSARALRRKKGRPEVRANPGRSPRVDAHRPGQESDAPWSCQSRRRGTSWG